MSDGVAVRFNGTAGSEYTAADTSGITGSVLTVTCWAMLSVDKNGYQGVWGLAPFVGGLGYNVTTDSGGTALHAENPDDVVFGSQEMVIGDWYRTALVVNGTDVTFYVGAAEGSLTSTNVTSSAADPAPDSLFIGRTQFNSTQMNGRIAAFKLWSAALTQTQVEAELAQFDPVITANLVRYHPFHVAETTDYSGNGRTLTAGAGTIATEDDPPSLGPPPISERFTPDAILAQTGLTGAVGAIQDDPDSPDGNWLTA